MYMYIIIYSEKKMDYQYKIEDYEPVSSDGTEEILLNDDNDDGGGDDHDDDPFDGFFFLNELTIVGWGRWKERDETFEGEGEKVSSWY